MKNLFRKEVVIGICVLLALVILFFGIDYLKGINVFKAANYYYVSYEDAKGLTISAPVSANGFKVGQVRDVRYEYDNPGHVLVELSLDKALKVPQKTKAILGSDVLGTASITLEMEQNGMFHNVGDTIEGVVSSGLLDDVSNSIMPSVTSIIPKVDTLLTAVNTLVADPALSNSIKRLDNITANIEASTSKLNVLMGSLSPVMGNIEDFTSNLTEISNDLSKLSAELKDFPLDSTMNDLSSTIQNILSLTEKLNNQNSTLGLLLNDSRLYDSLNGSIGSLDSLLIDIKKNPKRYISIKLL